MAIITTSTYSKVRLPLVETVYFPNIPGRYVDNTSWTEVTVEAVNDSSPVRPDHRSKPTNLLAALTPRGPFYREIYRFREEVNVRTGAFMHNGVSVTWYETTHTYNPYIGYDSTGLAAPDVSIPLRNAIKNERVSLAESIGEWRETARAVSGGAAALRNVAQFVASLRRTPYRYWPKRFRKLWNRRRTLSLHDIPAAYVVTQFGVLPWIELAVASGQALALRDGRPLVRRFKVSRTSSASKEVQGTYGGARRTRESITMTSVAYVIYKSNIGCFTAGNPLEAIWAGVPCSFMVDWFLGVGSWLSAIDALDGVSSYTGCTTRRDIRTVFDSRVNRFPTGSLARKGSMTRKFYQRTPLSTVMPALPQWRPSVSWGKLMSSMAILHQLKRGACTGA